jgi:hypothetical protein
VAFVVIGLLLAYLVTSFTYGQDPDDGVIDFSRPTQTASASVSGAAGTQDNFGTKAAGIFSQFGSTTTAPHTATPTVTPTRTPGITEQPTKRKQEDPFTATPRPDPTTIPTKKPKPTGTGTKVPTVPPADTPTNGPQPPENTGTPMPPAGGALISGSFSLQGSSANLAGPPFAGGVTDQSLGSCSSFFCRLIVLIFQHPGG